MKFYNHNAFQEALSAKEVSALGSSLKILTFSRNYWNDDVDYLTPGALLRAVAASCYNLVVLSIHDGYQVWVSASCVRSYCLLIHVSSLPETTKLFCVQ